MCFCSSVVPVTSLAKKREEESRSSLERRTEDGVEAERIVQGSFASKSSDEMATREISRAPTKAIACGARPRSANEAAWQEFAKAIPELIEAREKQ
jgi:hypothetical protein